VDISTYAIKETENVISPALIYYKDIILANTKRVIDMAGGAANLWPHVKSHKTVGMIHMQISLGITKFKCATIAEAEMTAGAADSFDAAHSANSKPRESQNGVQIILAYPLVGPNVSRFLNLAAAYPRVTFYAIGDNFDTLSVLSQAANGRGLNANVLIDVDMGMHRTGVPLDSLLTLYERCASLPGLSLRGMHCYDGHRNDYDLDKRKEAAKENDLKVLEIKEALKQKGLVCEIMVMGGTPSFPCRLHQDGFYLSPGTLFLSDWATCSKFPDIAFPPGAALFTRVVSRQTGNSFTLDLGHKGIAADPSGDRGVIAGFPNAKALFQSEEHWVFSLPQGEEPPPIGSGVYVIPTHICPTSALYPEILVAESGEITDTWQVAARNRKINF